MTDSAIAIVGMACRYPDADTVDDLLENSLAQRRAFRRLPASRLHADYFDESGRSADRSSVRQAAVLNGFEFDREWFRVSQRSYAVTDPTHWLALTVAKETIDDVRFTPGRGHPDGDGVRVVVANTLTGEFSRASLMRLRWPYVARVVARHLREREPDAEAAELDQWMGELEADYKRPFPVPDENFLAGGLANTIAGRICNHFDFKGGGYAVDGACASSLLAVADACSALVAGDADMVLAGGVDLSLDPFELVGFSRSAALARNEMLVYDQRSQGFWPGEGCGFVALMRYADAREQCERIHGVIRGWGISSDGRGGLTRPESAGQQLAITRCYDRAGYGIDAVGYFEGHGTGTRLGDTAELGALIGARRAAGAAGPPAVISSIKANIGHTKAAAGLAGLLRATKCLSERILPPTTACVRPHDLLVEHADTLTTSDRPRSWDDGTVPRRAGVSAMGFGGINTHVTVEQPPTERSGAALSFDRDRVARLAGHQDAELFLFLAATRSDLVWTVDHVAGFAAECSRSELTDLAVELARRATRDTLGTWRAAVVAATPAELHERLEQLQGLLRTAPDDVVHLAPVDGVFVSGGGATGCIGLVFPGQAAPARVGGGAHGRRFDEVRAVYRAANLDAFGRTDDTDFAQPAIVAASVAGLRLIELVGIEADLAVGHSLGELAAFHWAGRLDEDGVLRTAAARGRVMVADGRTSGAMAAIAAGRDDTRAMIDDREQVVVANINSPSQTVVTGDREQVEALAERCRRQGVSATVLSVQRAFHSPAMSGVGEVLRGELDTVSFHPAVRTMVSTMTGRPLDPNVDVVDYLCGQLSSPVQFLAAVRHMARHVDLMLEIGPGELMGNLVRGFEDTPVVSVDVGGESVAGYLRAAGAAFVVGRTPEIGRLFTDRFARRFDWDWRPRFLQNPCEADLQGDEASPSSIGVGPGVEGTDEVRVTTVDLTADSRDQVRQVIAEHTGLPAWTIEDESRMLSELHLNSITVAEVIVRLVVARHLAVPVDPSEYADATVAEIADALDRMADLDDVSQLGSLAPGIASWVRDFEVVLGPADPLAQVDVPGRGEWEAFGEVTPAVRELLQRLRTRALGDGVLVCLADRPGIGDLEPLLASAQRCAERVTASDERLRYVVVQHGWGAGGFARSFAMEQPSIDVLVVDVPAGAAPETAMRWVEREIGAAPTGFREVVVDTEGKRAEPLLRHVSRTPTTTPVVGAADVVLVTGGGKGISAECGLELARRRGCALLVVGRSDPGADDDLAANLQRLHDAGVRVSYQVCDVVDPAAVAAAIAAGTDALGGPVTGIVHGAGRNEPQSVRSLTVVDVEATLGPKLVGLDNVLGAVDSTGLRFLAVFSSIIARTGLRGEADYALANEWVSVAVADFAERNPRCRCRAIEWSVWSGTGMGQRLGRVDVLSGQGIAPITVDDGVREFLRVIDDPSLPTRVVVTGRFGQPTTTRLDRGARPAARFLDTILVDYPGVELVAESDLTPESDPYLDDHVLDGERLLPAVMALEAMSEAAVALLGRRRRPARLRFSEIEFRAGIVVPPSEDGRLTIRVLALADPVDPDELRLAIRCSTTNFQVDHVVARCRAAVDGPTVVEAPAAALAEGQVVLDPGRALYDDVLFQRGRFERIDGYYWLEARGCSARISADGASQWFAAGLPETCQLGDPGARDAALHAIQACIPHKVVIPVSVDRLDVAPLDPSQSHRMVATEVEDRGNELVYDMSIVDDAGAVVEHWHRIVFRVVGEPRHRRLSSPPLMASSFERRAAATLPAARLRVAIESASRTRPLALDPRHRPDGRPDPDDEGDNRSTSYCGAWRLDVRSAWRVGADIEVVVHRAAALWEALIGSWGLELAHVVSELAGEELDMSATRVWTARESMKKAGLPPAAPLVVDVGSSADWVVFTSGDAGVLSSVVDEPASGVALCVAVAVRPSVSAAGPQMASGRHLAAP